MNELDILQPIAVVIVGLIAQAVMLASVLKVSITYIEKNLARVESEAVRAHYRLDKLLEDAPWRNRQAAADLLTDDLKKVQWMRRRPD